MKKNKSKSESMNEFPKVLVELARKKDWEHLLNELRNCTRLLVDDRRILEVLMRSFKQPAIVERLIDLGVDINSQLDETTALSRAAEMQGLRI